jgi:predicted RNA-binding Zn ribbon-like protein
MSDLLGLEWGEEKLSSWGEYFQTLNWEEREQYHYPPPLSPGFWKLYTEPIHEFILAARELRDAVIVLGQCKDGRSEAAKASDATQRLAALSGGVSPIILVRQGKKLPRLSEHWVSTSLIGSLAMMAHLDQIGRHRVLRCANPPCSHLFVTSAYQAEYCSIKCREAAQKRRYRARTKEAQDG